MSYKRILVAVDGSKTSALAFKEALKLAKAFKSRLCILHVMERLPDHIAYAIDVAEYQTVTHTYAEKILSKFAKLAKQHKISHDTVLIEIVNYQDKIASKILKAVKKWKANLLVMGTHGRTGLSHLIVGSVAEEMLKSTRIPIFLVRKP